MGDQTYEVRALPLQATWATLLDALAIFHSGTSFFTLICLLTAMLHSVRRASKPLQSAAWNPWGMLARHSCSLTEQHRDSRIHTNQESESDADDVEKASDQGRKS